MPSTVDALASWRDTPARTAIVDFVERATTTGSDAYVPPEERIATFDNDGTLWSEKPMPIQLDFILRRLAAAAEKDPSLRDRQPWKAAYAKDFHWLGEAMVKHYQGDESDLKTLAGAVLQDFGGLSVEEYEAAASEFLHTADHPTLGRPYRHCGFRPMVELLRYLETNGFTTYIASGGDRDFMRAITQAIYRIPPERVIGSSNALRYEEGEHGGTLAYLAEPDVFDDGPVKPVRIWSRIGRRPILAVGNSNGDVPMLAFAGGPSRPALRLLTETLLGCISRPRDTFTLEITSYEGV